MANKYVLAHLCHTFANNFIPQLKKGQAISLQYKERSGVGTGDREGIINYELITDNHPPGYALKNPI